MEATVREAHVLSPAPVSEPDAPLKQRQAALIRLTEANRAAWTSRAISGAGRGFAQDTIPLREAQVRQPRSATDRWIPACEPSEQSVANGAFALGMATGIGFLAATLMLAKLLIM